LHCPVPPHPSPAHPPAPLPLPPRRPYPPHLPYPPHRPPHLPLPRLRETAGGYERPAMGVTRRCFARARPIGGWRTPAGRPALPETIESVAGAAVPGCRRPPSTYGVPPLKERPVRRRARQRAAADPPAGCGRRGRWV